LQILQELNSVRELLHRGKHDVKETLHVFRLWSWYEHVYLHKAAQQKKKEQHKKTAIYSLAYIYIKQVVHQINSWTLRH